MNLFKKKDYKPEEPSSGQPTPQPLQQEQLAEPIVTEQQINIRIRQEAKRLRLTEHILSDPQLQREKEGLRLAETKLTNIEGSLEQAKKQQELTHRHNELTAELNEARTHLYEVNKQCAAVANEEKELARFETFENVQGLFQRLTILENEGRANKQEQSRLQHNAEEMQHLLSEEQKRLLQFNDEVETADAALIQSFDTLANAQHSEGIIALIDIQLKMQEDRLACMQSQHLALLKEEEEKQAQLAEHHAKLERNRQQAQSIVMHQRMAEHGELVIAWLERLQELYREQKRTDSHIRESLRLQTDENEMLGRVYTQYQESLGRISQLEDELNVHRQNNLGLNSYDLQERAMNLKSRRQMLISAQSLWNRIAAGYQLIEEKKRTINAIRLHLENLSNSITPLESQVSTLRRTTHEKEYSYTLSKSQNVIQLRSDLKEGVGCSVCGATHHPYHSDTMLEQNKLIGEMRTDYEMMAAELLNKEKTLNELKTEQIAEQARKESEEDTLILLQQRQNNDVKEWDIYRQLDRSFEDCSPSTNLDARTAMIRQLIEKISSDAETAQKELDTFNFHQTRINELNVQMGTEVQLRNELSTRLNEVNTACQVKAGHVERHQQHMQSVSDSFEKMFEQLDKFITLPDWLSEWKRSPENIIMQIKDLTTRWQQLNETISQEEVEEMLQQQALDARQQQRNLLQTDIAQINEDILQLKDTRDKAQKEIERLLDGLTSKQFFDLRRQALATAIASRHPQQQKVFDINGTYNDLNGRYQQALDTGRNIDARTIQERSALDVWIRQYNASHSPVQYSELATFFSQDKDWNEVRSRIRQLRMDALFTQHKVDQLRSALVSLQAEGYRSTQEGEDALEAIASQMDTLTVRRSEVMLEIARHTLAIEAHHKAQQHIKEELMRQDEK